MLDLKSKRNLIGLTQIELAYSAKVSPSLVRKIEYGQRRPSVAVAKRIAAVLGFDWTEFFKEIS